MTVSFPFFAFKSENSGIDFIWILVNVIATRSLSTASKNIGPNDSSLCLREKNAKTTKMVA